MINTNSRGAYCGGVLAPSGGEKISTLCGFDFKNIALSSFFNKL
jgi:hypothetical protein